MINETIVTVEPSGVAFMGEFEVSGDLRFDDAYDTQKHYSNLFSQPRRPKGGFLNWPENLGAGVPGSFIAEYRKDQSEMATQRFLQSSRSLAEASWRAWIERASAEDGDNKGVTEQPDQQNGNE